MQPLVQFLNTAAGSEAGVLGLVFAAVIVVVFLGYAAMRPVMETRRRMRTMSSRNREEVRRLPPGASDGIGREIETYYDTILKGDKDSLKARLIQAGYFSPNAMAMFNLVRLGSSIVMFTAGFMAIDRIASGTSSLQVAIVAGFVGMLGFILPNFILAYMAKGRQEQYRRTFPDFVDMLVVCADAGLSIEAAAQRVSREFLLRDRAFGIHLGVMMLEVRAGKRLRDALNSLADRTGLEEARALATLFRQSEELGVSLTRALRTHSSEMRKVRMLRAEEKANVLPVKLLLPLGGFVFPTTLVIVLVPIVMTILDVFKNMSPG